MSRDFKKDQKDELWNKGLSTGNAEEGGDFMGTGEVNNEKSKNIENKTLSTGKAEEGGDSMGSGEMNKEENKEKGSKNKSERGPIKKPVGNPDSQSENEPKGTSGTIPYQPEYNKIPAGTTGSNKQRVPGVDKSGPGEA